MRGWLFNNLGPANSASNAAANFGADIKVELIWNTGLNFSSSLTSLRDNRLFRYGNIWDRTGPYAFSLASMINHYAWDAGIGLRIGSPIGPFRFDFAYKLRDQLSPRHGVSQHGNSVTLPSILELARLFNYLAR